MLLKRLQIIRTFNINETGRIRFVFIRGIQCSTRRWIFGEKGDEVFDLFDSLYKIR